MVEERLQVLVTGGAGFIGRRLVDGLAGRHDVTVLDNLHPQVHGLNATFPGMPEGVTAVRGDVTDADIWDSLLARTAPDVVVHLAAETGTGQSLTQASRHASVNVLGTAALMDGFSRWGRLPSAVVLTSSRAVYGEGLWRDPVSGAEFYALPRTPAQLQAALWAPVGPNGVTGTPIGHDAERVEPRPTNVYAATKLAQEHLLQSWCASTGVALTVLRLQNVYGPGQALGNPYTGVLTFFVSEALNGRRIEVYEGGGIVRDFVHVTDVCRTLASVVERSGVPKGRSEVFDIGSGRPEELYDIASSIARVVGTEPPVRCAKYRLGDVRAAFASIARAADRLRYAPKVPFDEGVTGLVDWAREQIDAQPAE